jgi:IMP dehydrogenase
MKMSLKLERFRALTFDDVQLVPRYSSIRSRKKEVDLSVKLNNSNIVLGAPFIASPMDKVSGPKMAVAIQREKGGIAILHRYCSIEQQCRDVSEVVAEGFDVGAAVGVSDDFLERASAVIAAGAGLICVDIAHGHHILMRDALSALRLKFPNTHIMAGNVATLHGFNDLSDWGADSVRCGVGSGSICSTRIQTGHGVPMLQNIFDVANTNRATQIISDGGIREHGDIVKALGAGAHMVMMGSMFAGTDEAPGEVITTERGPMKSYRGMASPESQTEWRGFYSSNEGVSTMIPYKGPLSVVLDGMTRGVEGGLSYSGARNLEELRLNAHFIEVSSASAIEAHPHILTR